MFRLMNFVSHPKSLKEEPASLKLIGKLKSVLVNRLRFHSHFTPTGSSWLNLVERWFALLTETLYQEQNGQ